MGKKRKRVRNGREVDRILDRHGCSRRRCKGSHAVGTLPDGTKLTYHYHGEYRPGIATKITKVLARAGLLILVLGYVAFYFGAIGF